MLLTRFSNKLSTSAFSPRSFVCLKFSIISKVKEMAYIAYTHSLIFMSYYLLKFLLSCRFISSKFSIGSEKGSKSIEALILSSANLLRSSNAKLSIFLICSLRTRWAKTSDSCSSDSAVVRAN